MAPKTNTTVPSFPPGHLDVSLESTPPGFPNPRWIRYCQIKAALESDGSSPPPTTTLTSGLPGGRRTSHPIPHPSSLASAPASRNCMGAIQSVVTTPVRRQLAYSSKGVQTTPSLVAECLSTVEISSESEDERVDGTAAKIKNSGGNSSLTGDHPKRRVIIIDSESSASDDDYSLKVPGAYPASDSSSEGPVTPTPAYVPRWLISPTHIPTPAQRQPNFRRTPPVQTRYASASLDSSVDA